MPYENEFLFKIYFHMFKREADKINANLKEIVDAHKKIEREYQRLRDSTWLWGEFFQKGIFESISKSINIISV